MRPLRLMVVTDPATSRHDVVDVALAAVAGGADVVQVRGARTDRELVELSTRVVRAVHGRALVLVNDRVDAALAAGAGGVHLKSDGLPVPLARRLAREAGAIGFHVGVAAHDATGLRRAAEEGADHVTIGPLRDAHGSPGVGEERLAGWIREAAAAAALPPVLILGGVGEDDADLATRLSSAGFPVGLAAIRLFQEAPTLQDVTRRAARLAAALSGGGGSACPSV